MSLQENEDDDLADDITDAIDGTAHALDVLEQSASGEFVPRQEYVEALEELKQERRRLAQVQFAVRGEQ